MAATDVYYRVDVTAKPTTVPLSPLVAAIEVDEDETRPSRCTVRVDDPHTVLADALREGVVLEVEVGTLAEHCLVFRGRVHQVEEEFGADRAPVLSLHAHDHRMRLGLRPRSRQWSDTTLREIIRTVATDHGLDVDVSAGLVADVAYRAPGVRQHDETDLAFAMRVAAENGCLLALTPTPSGDRLDLVSEARLGTGEPLTTLVLDAATDPGCQPLAGLRARWDVASIDLPADLAGFDPDQAQPARATGTAAPAAADTPGTGLVTLHQRAPQQASLVDRLLPAATAQAQLLRIELGDTDVAATAPFATAAQLNGRIANRSTRFRQGMRATGSTTGNPRLRPLTTVRIAGAGGRFSGTWLVSRTRHVLDAKGYRTEIDLRR